MTIPQAIADKIAELEAQVAEKQAEINGYSQTIGSLQERVQAECKAQDEAQDKLDLLRFAVEQYEAQPVERVEIERVEMQPFVGDIELVENWGASDNSRDDPTPPPAPPASGSIKEQVYNAMNWLTPPVQAKAVAEAIGCDWRQVAPTFGALSKEGKIKPAPSGAGWVRAGGLVLALILGGAGAAQAQYVQAPNIYAPSNWPMLRMEQMMQQQTQQPQPYQFGVGMPGGIYGGGRSCVFIPGTGEVCR